MKHKPLIDSNCLKLLFILSVLTLDCLVCCAKTCQVDLCSQEYSDIVNVRHQINKPAQHRRHQNHQRNDSQNAAQLCPVLNAYHICMKTLSKPCRGNLEYHTVQSLVTQWIHRYNCSDVKHNNKFRPNIKSGSNVNPLTDRGRKNNLLPPRITTETDRQKIIQCRNYAYNYTLDQENFNEVTKQFRDNRMRNWPSMRARTDDRVLVDGDPVKSTNNRRNGGQKVTMARRIRSQEENDQLDNDDDEEENGDEDDEEEDYDDADENENDIDDTDKQTDNSSVALNSNDFNSIPTTSMPDEPLESMTCLIYGDPHLRTFANKYQTCKCVGAWPLIDHPLFAVQITNSRIKELSQQITGVTKVTVLIRQFTWCDINSDLLYEAESSPKVGGSSVSLPTTFIDGSSSAANNIIRIEPISSDKVVIRLDHLEADVHIAQFSDSNYLSVVIKFRNKMSQSHKLQLLNAIRANSLCRVGCPSREQIDIRNILKATGVDVMSASFHDENMSEDVANAIRDQIVKVDQSNLADPCSGLYGFYRISCLYDVQMKGLNNANNACRFAQNFDDMKVIKDSFLVEDDDNNNSINSDYNVKLAQINNIGATNLVSLFHVTIYLFIFLAVYKPLLM